MGKDDQIPFLFFFHSHYVDSDLMDKSLKSHRTLDKSALFRNLSKTLFVKKREIYLSIFMSFYFWLSIVFCQQAKSLTN